MGSTRGMITGFAAVVAAGTLVGVIVADVHSTDCLSVGQDVADRLAAAVPIRIDAIAAVHAPWIERRGQYDYETYHVIAATFTGPDGSDYVGTWAYGSDGTNDELPPTGAIMVVNEPARRWTVWGPPPVTIAPDDRATQHAEKCLA